MLYKFLSREVISVNVHVHSDWIMTKCYFTYKFWNNIKAIYKMFKNHKRHSNKHHFIQNAINKSCCHFFSICTPFSPICQQSILQWMFDDKSSNKHTHTMESKFTFPFPYFGWHVSITSTPYPFSWTHPRSPCLTDSITLSSCHHGFHLNHC